MKSKKTPKIKVNAKDHAIAMVKKGGVQKVKSVALGLVKSLSSQNFTKLHNEKEINSLKNFWINVLGVVSKMEKR